MATNSSRSSAWKALRLTILERDHHQCAYCGREATEVDHIVALNNGGPELDPSNLVASCKSCNGRKSDRPLVRNNWYSKAWLNNI